MVFTKDNNIQNGQMHEQKIEEQNKNIRNEIYFFIKKKNKGGIISTFKPLKAKDVEAILKLYLE